MIRNLADLAASLGTDADMESISRRIYETTACGAWTAEWFPAEAEPPQETFAAGNALAATATAVSALSLATGLLAGAPAYGGFPVPIAEPAATEPSAMTSGIVVGGSVEGSEDGIAPVELAFPFTRRQFDAAVAAIESRAEEIREAMRAPSPR